MPRGRPVLLLRGSQRFYETPRRGEPYASRHNAVVYFCRREGKDASRPKSEPSGWGREPGPLGAGNPSLASLGQGRWQAGQCLGVQRRSLACRTFQQRRPILGRVTSEAKLGGSHFAEQKVSHSLPSPLWLEPKASALS